jgi:ATP-dependent Clp protease ATP-binding subunit ClpA
MFERFDRRSRAVVMQAREEAQRLGATKLEAEHLVLALSRQTAWDAGRLLERAGLDHDGLTRALDAELNRSLAAVGIVSSPVGLLEQPLPATGQPRWGASAKRALQQASSIVRARGDRSLRPMHILLGALQAREGTVPRALAEAGVDAKALAALAEATLGDSA